MDVTTVTSHFGTGCILKLYFVDVLAIVQLFFLLFYLIWEGAVQIYQLKMYIYLSLGSKPYS